MKPTNLPRKSHSDHIDAVNRIAPIHSRGLILRVSAILALAVLLVSSFYLSSAASTSNRTLLGPGAAAAPRSTTPATVGGQVSSTSFGLGGYASLFMLPQGPPPPPSPYTITTYDGGCSTPKSVFNLQDTDKTVCAKVTGAPSTWRLIWSNADSVAVQNVAVGSGTSTFTLTSGSSLGDWRVILYEPFGGSVQSVTTFTVIDANNPSADLTITKSAISSSASSGSQILFSIQLTNNGPSAATAVQMLDTVPTGTTLYGVDQLGGPTFTCTGPMRGDTGTTTCTIASLARGESATFVATYLVGNVSTGTVISNTATASSTTADPNSLNNSSTAELQVISSPCQLSIPANITVSADLGQSGAVVTYATPTGTGNCGQTITGENGEIIPPISCNPASGSFFPVGTSTVICIAQTGPAVSFQVTVDNPGSLSISLNGASTVSVECGTDFNDPGASAVNGTGQSVPVTITYPAGFDPSAPAVGSYIATYTATENPNSVSTTRTINVTDTEAPHITVNGANPYKIQQGSCSPFVDPGATAIDGCAGPKPVSSSVSGPGGATSVNPSIPGTYTVTYTATDGSHQSTATRTVLVGNFPQDEVDQPASANVPPTITLIGDDQITIECGTPFTDPGATATVCGGSIPVTTTGTVNIHSPGTYSITYAATANSLTTTATRTVTVEADNTAPTIEVLGANPMTVECHTSFTDPGATAHDACAGDFAATASGAVDPNTVGSYTITYNASDPSGHAATAVTRTVNVVDTTKPVVTAPADVTVYTGAGATSCTVTVSDATLGSASASDSCQGSLPTTRSGVPAGNIFPAGTTTITYSATDASNNTGTATQTVTVIDNTPPTITLNGQTPSMWPPNHKYRTFQVTDFVTAASDNCDAHVGISSVVIDHVTSDEIENGNGDGNTMNDIVIGPDCRSVQLRAEREGNSNGRVYTITFKVTDAAGNSTTATAKVLVAHNPGETVVDSGPHYTVTGSCL
jgi:uncharacterized repeat protein (TIGR01451 family)